MIGLNQTVRHNDRFLRSRSGCRADSQPTSSGQSSEAGQSVVFKRLLTCICLEAILARPRQDRRIGQAVEQAIRGDLAVLQQDRLDSQSCASNASVSSIVRPFWPEKHRTGAWRGRQSND